MTLDTFLKIVRRYWLILVTGLILGVLVALGLSLVQPKVYSANSSGFVTTASGSSQGSNGVGTALAGDSYAKSRVKSYADLGTKRVVAEQVIKDLGLTTTPEDLVQKITVTVPTDTVTIKVTAKASTPREASDLANEWIIAMAAEIKQLEGGNTGTAAATLTPLESAALPTHPSSPNTRLYLALGAVVGLALGLGVALVRKQYDRRIRSTSDVTALTDVPVVGMLPAEQELENAESRLIPSDYEGAHDTRRSSSTRQFDEAMRELRTNLEFLDVDNPPRAIVVTSAVPGDGKSTVAANLAVTIAETGRKVVLIDGDLRRPTMARSFGIPGEVGLTDLLAGRLDLEAVLQRWHDDSTLFLLPAGSIPPNPSELLGSASLRELISELTKQSATVIIDSPPLLPVTDAAVLTARNDGALVVISAGRTAIDELGGALDALDKVKGKPLGIVLNRVPTTGADKYGYKYYRGNYYYYDSVDENGQQVKHRRKPKEHEPTATAPAPSAGPNSAPARPRRAASSS